MKPDEQPDSKEHFSAVRQQRGRVRRDTDWNAPRSGTTARFSRHLLVGIASCLALAAGLAVAVLALGGPIASVLEARRQPALVVALVFPEDSDTVPLHSSLWVRGEVVGRSPAAELILVVNGQTWGTTTLTARERSASWGWTPSGEGRHELTVVARNGAGETFSSPTISVYATALADLRVPYQHTVLEGESLAMLGDAYSSSTEEIFEANAGLAPDTQLNPGDVVTIPMHVPTGPAQSPESGSPAPPSGPLPEKPPGALPPQGDDTPFGEVVAALHTLPVPPGFTIKNGVLIPSQPVDKVYLYVAVGSDDWHRIPKDPHEFIPAAFGAFNLKPYLDFAALDNLLEPVLLKAEGWGWAGGTLVSLGSYSGYYGAGQLHWPYGGTDLQVYSHQTLGKKYFTTKANISGDDPSWELQFRWSSQTTGVDAVAWQVSEKPFPNSLAFNPAGLIQYGIDWENPGEFNIDFRDYFLGQKPGGFFESIVEAIGGTVGEALGGVIGEAAGSSSAKMPPSKQFWPFLSRTLFVRAVPLGGGASAEPSNTIVVYFTPSGKPVPISGPLSGPVYEARIVGFDPYLPPDPKYSACWVTNFEQRDCRNIFGYGGTDAFQWSSISEADVESGRLTMAEYQQCEIRIPKGMFTCGCPGAPCDSGGGGFDPVGWAADGLQKLGELAAEGWDPLAGVYNDAVAFVKKMVAELNPFCIQAKIAAAELGGDTVTKEDVADVCQAVADIAVTAVMTYFGLPPSLPEFDKLLDEGLDYAIGIAASEMGIECNKQCRDLLKEGFQAAASGENLLD